MSAATFGSEWAHLAGVTACENGQHPAIWVNIKTLLARTWPVIFFLIALKNTVCSHLSINSISRSFAYSSPHFSSCDFCLLVLWPSLLNLRFLLKRRLSAPLARVIFFAAMAARFLGYQGQGQIAHLVIISLLPSLGSYKKNTVFQYVCKH